MAQTNRKFVMFGQADTKFWIYVFKPSNFFKTSYTSDNRSSLDGCLFEKIAVSTLSSDFSNKTACV